MFALQFTSKMISRLLSFVWSSEQISKSISCYFCGKLLMERIVPPWSGGISRNIPPSSGPHRARKVWTGWRGPRAGLQDEQRAGEPALWGETGGEVVPLFNNNKIISLGLSVIKCFSTWGNQSRANKCFIFIDWTDTKFQAKITRFLVSLLYLCLLVLIFTVSDFLHLIL